MKQARLRACEISIRSLRPASGNAHNHDCFVDSADDLLIAKYVEKENEVDKGIEYIQSNGTLCYILNAFEANTGMNQVVGEIKRRSSS
jgi:hypothetical protein